MIKPSEDITWPGCSHLHSLEGRRHWCNEVANTIRSNEDLINLAGDICVPYLPSEDLYAACRIGEEVSPEKMPGVYRLYVIKNVPLVPEPFDREEIELALWTQGEGRASICLTVRDWVRGLAGTNYVPCTFVRHGYRENQKIEKFNARQFEVNDFFCATETACWFCFNAAQAVGNPGDFLDPADDTPSPQRQHIQGQLRRGQNR